ncbi:hypothetical protein D5S17_19260 [Pseudonocardiaceae bacterium YIM PH 21723]|nr:hypothetical protein D5S17_19260 [Pseudonocardiaceae bacterium YIM PH 21723]
MSRRSTIVALIGGTALIGAALLATNQGDSLQNVSAAPPAAVAGVAEALNISEDQARTRLLDQDKAHRAADSLTVETAGKWIDQRTGKLTVAVTDQAAADQARAQGVEAKLVSRGQSELDRLNSKVRSIVGSGVPGIFGWGTDVEQNIIKVNVNTAASTADTEAALGKITALGSGVQVVKGDSQPRQQSGDLHTGDPWWPGGESNCSVGFVATDSSGAKQMLTAGHCTNDVNQPAYGEQGQKNKLGTSNVGGTHSVNAKEGDMGVVAVTESGWTLNPKVNTWGGPDITVSGSVEAIVGDAVCHSGNTSKWKCGTVKYTHKAVSYGSLVIEDMTWTDACSLGGDSGGGWLVGSKATGLHDGGPSQCVTNPKDDDMSIFQPVNEALTKWGLTLVTTDVPPTSTTTTPPTTTPTTTTSVPPTTTTTTTPAPGNRTFRSDTQFPIKDNDRVFSPIQVSLTGQAAGTATLAITIQHTCSEDLGISLIDPSGKAYAVKYSGGYSCTAWNGAKNFTVPKVSGPAGGKWQIRVTDYGPGDTGTLDGWTLTV